MDWFFNSVTCCFSCCAISFLSYGRRQLGDNGLNLRRERCHVGLEDVGEDVGQSWLFLRLRAQAEGLKLGLYGVRYIAGGREELCCLLLVLQPSERAGSGQPWWSVHEGFLVGLTRPCHRSCVRLGGMALSFALAVRLVDDPPCATFPASVAALDFCLAKSNCSSGRPGFQRPPQSSG